MLRKRPFRCSPHDQAAFQVDAKAATDYLTLLRQKCSVDQLLRIKAEARGMTLTDDALHADEKYTYEWALNPNEVSALLN